LRGEGVSNTDEVVRASLTVVRASETQMER
jgi:hypothetical protein